MSKARENMMSILRSLGKKYEIKVIDGSECIYRDFGNGYDVEILTYGKKSICTIVLWQTSPDLQILKQVDVPWWAVNVWVEKLYEGAAYGTV